MGASSDEGTSAWRTIDPAQRHLVISSLAGLALLFFDQTAVIVALPAIRQQFGSTPSATQWTVTSYLLALAVFMPLVGRVADRYGRKTVLLTGLALFAIGSAACAAAPTLVVLIGCRFLQGIGAAVMQPLALAVGTAGAPANRRGWLIGLMSTGGTSFLILGPLIAAALLTVSSWRVLFLINLPVVAFAFVQVRRWLVATADRGDPVRWADATLLFAALLATVLGISELAAWGKTAVVCTVIGIGLLAFFLVRQSRIARPLIPLRYLRNRLLASCLIALFSVQFAVLASMIALVSYLERAMGETVIVAGLVVVATGIFTPILSTFTGRRADRRGARPLVVGGLVLATAGLTGAALAAPAVALGWLLPGLLIFSVARPAIFTPASIGPFATLPPADRGFAASLVTEARQLGAVFGVAAAGLTEDLIGGHTPATAVTAFAATMWVVVVVTAVAAAVTFRWMPGVANG
jgi:MFS family permease